MMANAPISWKSKAKCSVDTSSAMAEYVPIYEGSREAFSIRQFLNDIGFMQSNPTVIFSDNNAAIAIGNNTRTEERSKHIDIKYHYVRELVQEKHICLNDPATWASRCIHSICAITELRI